MRANSVSVRGGGAKRSPSSASFSAAGDIGHSVSKPPMAIAREEPSPIIDAAERRRRSAS